MRNLPQRRGVVPDLPGVLDGFDADGARLALFEAVSGHLAAQADGGGVIRYRAAVLEDELSVLRSNLLHPTLHEGAPTLLDEPADVDAVLAGGVDTGDHTRRHPRVIEVRRRVYEGDPETPPGDLPRAEQRMEVRVAAPGEDDVRFARTVSHSPPGSKEWSPECIQQKRALHPHAEDRMPRERGWRRGLLFSECSRRIACT